MVFSGKTDIGRVRPHNEDCWGSYASENGEALFLIVADGMGGRNAGEVASRIMVDIFIEKASCIKAEELSIEFLQNFLGETIKEANYKIFQEAQNNPEKRGMGTTAVACVLYQGKLVVANVGDSRAYISEKSRMVKITRDHSYVEDLLNKGFITEDEARVHPDKNIITRAVGCMQDMVVDIFVADFNKDNVLLMCSDGLSNMIEESSIQRIVRRNKNMEKLSERLISLAKKNGGSDNITVVVARRSDEVIYG